MSSSLRALATTVVLALAFAAGATRSWPIGVVALTGAGVATLLLRRLPLPTGVRAAIVLGASVAIVGLAQATRALDAVVTVRGHELPAGVAACLILAAVWVGSREATLGWRRPETALLLAAGLLLGHQGVTDSLLAATSMSNLRSTTEAAVALLLPTVAALGLAAVIGVASRSQPRTQVVAGARPSPSKPSLGAEGFAVAVLAAIPFAIGVDVLRGGDRAALRVPLAALLLCGAAAPCLRRGLRPLLDRLGTPLATLAVVVCAAATRAESVLGGAREFLQVAIYWGLGGALFASLSSPQVNRALGRVVWTLALAFGVIAAYQEHVLGAPEWQATGLLESRHELGTWLALSVAGVLGSDRLSARARGAWLLSLTALAVMVDSSGLSIAGAASGLAIRCWQASQQRFGVRPWVVAVGVLLGLALTAVSIRRGFSAPSAVRDACSVEDLRERRSVVRSLETALPLGTIEIGDSQVALSTSAWHPGREAIDEHRSEEVFRPDLLHQRYLEWVAALNALDGSLLGHGLGRYQTAVTGGYVTFPKLKTLEPGTQNGLLLTAVELGVGGLGCLCWLVLLGFAPTAVAVHGNSTLDRPQLLAGLLVLSVVTVAVPLPAMSLVLLLVAHVVVLRAPAVDDERPDSRQVRDGGLDSPAAG